MTSRQSPESGSRHGEFSVRDVVASYDVEARTLVPDYERLLFEKVHAAVLDRLPESTGCILDVGAGSGRDAAWFAAKGHKVVAVEPSVEMRTAGKERHKSPNIRWMADALPALDKVLRSKLTFDLIWLSAVWMHVPPNQRARALRKMVSVMSPGGSMMLSLRQGPPPPGRPMAPVTAAEVEMLARRYGLQTIRIERHPDAAGRIGISWEIIWLRLPDDGTGALPLLRHVVFNDHKSSTYKLALLRSLIRIADSAGGFARPGRDEQHVDLPLGLVALFWIRAFQPLIAKSFAQHPAGNGRLAFVKDGFRGLRARSAHDLRVGQQFTGEDARNLILAIRDAASCIRNMPATYIKYPGSSERVFSCARTPVRIRATVRVDDAFLWSFGTFSAPVGLWQAMSRYAPWIEPAVLNEWIEIMQGYASEPKSWDAHMAALRWLEPEHDTGVVRGRGRLLRESGAPLFCVWTRRRLTRDFDIDHCFPFAAWPCNDLWNLLPSSPPVNRSKGDRLPAAEALDRAKSCILEWWEAAYHRDTLLKTRFEDEARSALPTAAFGVGDKVTPESVFEGMMVQQMVLKRDQQLAEWSP
ncbi:methyltransferase domain-containing protein [Candidatus Rariloculus sp.]|uniref:methyltransferase domain-containing protein n=1 Tax=Candidatus Rariloculus sp. TaxID=3101265 RepID=UPI003D14F441